MFNFNFQNNTDFNYRGNNLNQYPDKMLLPEIKQYNNEAINENILA